MNFAGQVHDWSDSEKPAVAVTGVTCNYLTGSRPAVFSLYFSLPPYSLLSSEADRDLISVIFVTGLC